MLIPKQLEKWYVYPIIVVLMLQIGCTNPEVIYIDHNQTIYIDKIINQTHYENITIVMPCNITQPIINTTIYDKTYVLGLIQQLKRHEQNQDKYFNDSQCNDDLNKSQTSLYKAENELCQWNSSWC